MYIQCTQKLLTRLAKPFEKLHNPPHPKYCWHATLFAHMGVELFVALNDESGYAILLDRESLQDFSTIFTQKIQHEMEASNIPAENISQFLREAGPITFGPTANRSKVGILNGFTARLKEHLNSMPTFMDDDFEEEPQEVRKRPKPRRREMGPPMRILMVSLDADLQLLGTTKVSRSFSFPLETNFHALHVILQIGFDWYEKYPHEFDFQEIGCKVLPMLDEQREEMFEMSGIHDEQQTMLTDLLPAIQQFKYRYGEHLEWEIIIRVGKVGYADVDGPYAVCTKGEGASPSEDCGGPEGYEDVHLIYNGPLDDEEYETRIALLGDVFDKEAINEELQELEFTDQAHWGG